MLSALVTRLQQWWYFESEAERLRSYDDRLLSDMGIRRSKIGSIVRGHLPKNGIAPGLDGPKSAPPVPRGERSFARSSSPRRGALTQCTK